MHRFSQYVLTVAVVALIASPVCAQGQGRRGGGGGAGRMNQLLLANQKSVQEELKLSADQIEKVSAAYKKQQAAFPGLREIQEEAERSKKMQDLVKEGDKAVADALKPEQAKRLKQIYYQQLGAQAFELPDVAKELNLTADQKQKLKDIQAAALKERSQIFQPGGNREEMQKKMAEITKKTNTESLAVLTDEQKGSLKKLTGETFTGKIELGPPGGGRLSG
jgi:hypothetical protein